MTAAATLTDRSRIITAQECPRRRYLAYHAEGSGLTLKSQNIPLLTGTMVHRGLASLLLGEPIETVVADVVKAYGESVAARGLDVNATEDMASVATEQIALAEALLRVYHRAQLPKLLAEYEVLEVEVDSVYRISESPAIDLMFRPDGLLRHKETNDLYVLSFKTASMYDGKRAEEGLMDMQGLSELAGTEARLSEMWHRLFAADPQDVSAEELGCTSALRDYLASVGSAPKVQGIKMEYLIKGLRKEDGDSGRYIQWSHLIRGWWKHGITEADNEFAWKYTFTKPDGSSGRLGKGWERFNAWEMPFGIAGWIDMLASGSVQAGVVADDPIEAAIVAPVPYYRQASDVEDMLQQVIAQETRIANGLVILNTATTPDERRIDLNENFPQHRRSCLWPSRCSFLDLCKDSNIAADPLASGLYIRRVPHHMPELQKFQAAGFVPVEALTAATAAEDGE